MTSLRFIIDICLFGKDKDKIANHPSFSYYDHSVGCTGDFVIVDGCVGLNLLFVRLGVFALLKGDDLRTGIILLFCTVRIYQ